VELTFVGLSCVRLRGRDVEVVIDPIPPGVSSRPPRVNPDIVVRTEGSGDLALLRLAEGRPQEVSGPGEYELRGVSVFGVAADTLITIMRVEVDDVRVCALGRLRRQLAEHEIDALGHVDVLAVPVGGGDSLEAQAAARLVNALEPAIVVPVRYAVAGLEGEYDPVDRFAKEMGLAEGWAPQPKLNLTGSLPTSEETRVVVLEPRAVAS
jgi:L-ascorbate metabolism protein UlaG (beta-lactamase superfamily)